mmetsp:Transcript_24228/g.57163  ORF Transcript_24228/g.57163 Transcript_24228/m.57163 type:complete len:113 (+) Transcript_24228:5-343(+)
MGNDVNHNSISMHLFEESYMHRALPSLATWVQTFFRGRNQETNQLKERETSIVNIFKLQTSYEFTIDGKIMSFRFVVAQRICGCEKRKGFWKVSRFFRANSNENSAKHICNS